jgi:hypothetical protein
VLSMHLFSYLFKLSINWPGGVILSNMHSNCGGSVCSHNIPLLLSFCILSILWLQVQEGTCAGMCACMRVSIALVSGSNDCMQMPFLF